MSVYKKLFESKTENAHLIQLENGHDYVIKFYKPTENKALINEWIGYCLARFMGLPVPKAEQIQLPETFFNQLPNRKGIIYTPHQFAVHYVPDCVNGHETTVGKIVNGEDLAKIILFDYWLCNLDRTRKNILLKEKSDRVFFLYSIDQAEIFGSNAWTCDSLQTLPDTLLKSATHKMMASFIPNEQTFKEQLEIIQTIPTQFLEELFSFIPADWPLTELEKEAALQVLNIRRFQVLPKLIPLFIKNIYRNAK